MNFTIGEISKQLDIPIPTLRYYDQEGLLPFVDRDAAGRRIFKENDLNYLEVIKCLKLSGIPVKEISQFIQWCMDGDSTLEQRKNFFNEKEATLEEEIAQLESMLAFLQWKKWYYETAYEAGTENIHFKPGTREFDPASQEYYNSLQSDSKKIVALDPHHLNQ
ncbi:MAG: MerR family transcriptional regulator [Enterococcus sp.]